MSEFLQETHVIRSLSTWRVVLNSNLTHEIVQSFTLCLTTIEFARSKVIFWLSLEPRTVNKAANLTIFFGRTSPD